MHTTFSDKTLDGILISVVVPVYNVEQFLKPCVDSLLAQTHPNIQIILVNDGSTDKSGQICDTYSDSHSNILVIHKENGGLSSARNAGLQVAQGAFVGFVDSDDFVKKDMFRELLSAAIANNAQIASCGRFITDECGTVVDQCFTLAEPKVYNIREATKQILTCGKIDVAVWDKLFSRELFRGIEFPVGRINEDAAIIFNLLQKADHLVHIGAPMYYYRCRSGSITKSGYRPNKIQALEHAETIHAFLCQQSAEYAPFCRMYTAYTCCHQLCLMLKQPGARKEFPDHYARYLSGLRKNALYLYRNPNVSVAWKLRGTMVLCGLYEKLYALLK